MVAAKQSKAGVWNIEDGGSFVRLHMPTDKGRLCAPCSKESNLCCGGKKGVHIKPEGNLILPAIQWLRVRISFEEWAQFVAALDAANLEGTVPLQPLVICPCVVPLLPFQFAWCCIPLQVSAGRSLKRQNALNLAVAKFNKYLFMPRGIVARRQRQFVEPDGAEHHFLRLDLVQQQVPLTHAQLPHGLRPGTMHSDLAAQTRNQWLVSSDAYPCAAASQLPIVGPLFALPRLIPTPKVFHAGNEPELMDEKLAANFGMRNAEFAGAIRPDAMLRC